MKLWQKCLVAIFVAVLLLGARVYFVWKQRQDPGVTPPANGDVVKSLSPDELVVMKEHFYSTFDYAKALEGTTVWIKAGYSLPYYPYAGSVGFARRAGVLPSAEKLAIAELVKAAAPAREDNRVPQGDRQYFAVFSLEGKPGLWAAPIGYTEAGQETLFCDQLFYYDDPRKIYEHWPKDVWDAVAAHEPKVGLTENQTRMAVGILIQSDSKTEGNRTVTYTAGDKTWTVTFVKSVATTIKAG